MKTETRRNVAHKPEKRPVVRLPLPQELDDALNAIVRTYGIAKVEIIRHAIVDYLHGKNVIPPTLTYESVPVLSRGRLRPTHERKQ